MVNNEINDFGFTAIDEGELSGVNPLQERVDELETDLSKALERMDKMRAAIETLLTNLAKNPEKDIIKWPDRARKIAEFRSRLTNIQYGE